MDDFVSFEDKERLEKTAYFRAMLQVLDDPYTKAHILARLKDLYPGAMPDELRNYISSQSQQLREPLRALIDEKKRILASMQIVPTA
ncbi:MAG: hypothetical protein V1735_06670 [Nanoarchaeota archaeon]